MARIKRTFDVEGLLHWVFQVQKADRAIAIDTAQATGRSYVRSGDSVARVNEQAILGTRIDSSPSMGFDASPDAERVAEFMFSNYRGSLLGVILRNARALTRPDWAPEGVIFQPVRNLRGRPRIVYNANREPLYCEVTDANSREWVEACRAEYAEWWDALAYVAGEFSPETCRLCETEVTGFNAPFAPWRSSNVTQRLTSRKVIDKVPAS